MVNKALFFIVVVTFLHTVGSILYLPQHYPYHGYPELHHPMLYNQMYPYSHSMPYHRGIGYGTLGHHHNLFLRSASNEEEENNSESAEENSDEVYKDESNYDSEPKIKIEHNGKMIYDSDKCLQKMKSAETDERQSNNSHFHPYPYPPIFLNPYGQQMQIGSPQLLMNPNEQAMMNPMVQSPMMDSIGLNQAQMPYYSQPSMLPQRPPIPPSAMQQGGIPPSLQIPQSSMQSPSLPPQGLHITPSAIQRPVLPQSPQMTLSSIQTPMLPQSSQLPPSPIQQSILPQHPHIHYPQNFPPMQPQSPPILPSTSVHPHHHPHTNLNHISLEPMTNHHPPNPAVPYNQHVHPHVIPPPMSMQPDIYGIPQPASPHQAISPNQMISPHHHHTHHNLPPVPPPPSDHPSPPCHNSLYNPPKSTKQNNQFEKYMDSLDRIFHPYIFNR